MNKIEDYRNIKIHINFDKINDFQLKLCLNDEGLEHLQRYYEIAKGKLEKQLLIKNYGNPKITLPSNFDCNKESKNYDEK